MKKLITIVLLLVSVVSFAQPSLKTRLSNAQTYTDNNITTSVPPHLVYPVNVGTSDDSLNLIMASLVDTVRGWNLQKVVTAGNTSTGSTVFNYSFFNSKNTIDGSGVNLKYISNGSAYMDIGTLFGNPSIYLADTFGGGSSLITFGKLTHSNTFYVPNGSGVGALTMDSTGIIRDSVFTASANTNVVAVYPTSFLILPQNTTTSPTVTLYSSPTPGQKITVWNKNTSLAHQWSFASTVKDATGATITTLSAQTVYQLEYDGSEWLKIN
jgi:hypothetical protein